MSSIFEDDEVTTSEASLSVLARATNRADQLKQEIAHTEALLAQQKSELTRLLTSVLPEALNDARLPSVTTEGGRVITRKQIVSGTWPKGETDVKKAVAWLTEENLTDLIKCSIDIDFDRGDRKEAMELVQLIRDSKYGNKIKSLTTKESVHSQTLNAMLRERMTKGLDTPLELFKGFTTWVADISEPNTAKRK